MKIKKRLRTLHRQIGIFSALWLFVLASSGFILQHKNDWGLDNAFITNTFLLRLYGIGQHTAAFCSGEDCLIQIDQEVLINHNSTMLSNPLRRVAFIDDKWVVETHAEQMWFNRSGEMLQRFDDFEPSPLKPQEIKWLKASADNGLITQAISEVSDSYLSVAQVVFDLHAGITSPSILNDFAALALIFLSLSGLVIYFRKKRR